MSVGLELSHYTAHSIELPRTKTRLITRRNVRKLPQENGSKLKKLEARAHLHSLTYPHPREEGEDHPGIDGMVANHPSLSLRSGSDRVERNVRLVLKGQSVIFYHYRFGR